MKNATKLTLMILGLALVAAPGAIAQNNEIGLLMGAATPGAQVTVANIVSVKQGSTAAAQLSYSRLVRASSAANLYVELPVAFVSKTSVGVGNTFATAAKSNAFFTPGLKVKLFPEAVISPYAVAGFGAGWFEGASVSTAGSLRVEAGEGVKPAFAFGGGLDLNIVRHFGLRAEVRDFVATTFEPRNHLVVAGGAFVRF